LSPTTNKVSILGKKNLTHGEDEIAAIDNHKSLTFGIKSTSSKISIFNRLDEIKRKIISMLVLGNNGQTSHSISYS